MNRKTIETILKIAGLALGVAGLVLILLSVFAEMNTLRPGLLCAVLGMLCSVILTNGLKKEQQ